MSIVLTGLLMAGCALQELRSLRLELEETRSSDAGSGVLAAELDDASRARLELIGRTSAPTRYAERTDANRIRVVAFDFGGTTPGTRADAAGNLMAGSCLLPGTLTSSLETGPFNADPVPTPPSNKDFNFYKGMFRQYGKQVGTTIEFDAAIGPVGTKLSTYFSHNFLVLEWRRYQLTRLADNVGCRETHVSAVETGVAVRIVFDVRLATIDASLSATFGIAELAAALARNEATVEVSYEVVGTALDLLPREVVVISSLNEYLDALDKFHEAVVSIADAWQVYASSPNAATIAVHNGGRTTNYARAALFTPDDLAYYVSGPGVGDTYVHLSNVDACEDLQAIKDYYQKRVDQLEGELRNVEHALEWRKKRKAGQRFQTREDSRRKLRDLRATARELERARDLAKRRFEVTEVRFTQDNCEKSLLLENRRRVHACAASALEPGVSALSLAACTGVPLPEIEAEKQHIESIRLEQAKAQSRSSEPVQPPR